MVKKKYIILINSMSYIIYPSPSNNIYNVNEKMFAIPIFNENFEYIQYNDITSLSKKFKNKEKNINLIIVLLDNYGKFIENNIDFILINKHIRFFIHENDIHFLASKPNAYKRYMLLRDKLIENEHIYILAYYWYHYSKLYNINKNNLICFPRFVINNNILNINYSAFNKILLTGSCSSYYPMRRYLKSLNNPNVDILTLEEKITGLDYYKYLNKYLCSFTCCSNKNTPYIINKFFEIPASGCLLLAYDEYVKEELKELGFVDNINYISCDKSNLIDKINFIINPENIDKINEIRKNGYELVINNHTQENRYNLLFSLL